MIDEKKKITNIGQLTENWHWRHWQGINVGAIDKNKQKKLQI